VIHPGQNGIVFFQDAVYFLDVPGGTGDPSVVVGIPAGIAAEFLVGPPLQGLIAFEAFSFAHI